MLLLPVTMPAWARNWATRSGYLAEGGRALGADYDVIVSRESRRFVGPRLGKVDEMAGRLQGSGHGLGDGGEGIGVLGRDVNEGDAH